MQRRELTGIVGKLSLSRRVVGVIVSLIVLGGAAAAGSVIGKEDRTGSDGQAAGSSDLAKRSHIEYHVETEEAVGGAKLAFEIKDFSFGVENPTTIGSATGGAGAGKIKFNEFTIKKTTDQSSPSFFKNCAVGAHYEKVTIEIRKVSDKNDSVFQTFQKFEFGTVFTTKIDWSGPGDEGPEESITFVYGQLSVQYIGQNPEDSDSFAWDVVTNREP